MINTTLTYEDKLNALKSELGDRYHVSNKKEYLYYLIPHCYEFRVFPEDDNNCRVVILTNEDGRTSQIGEINSLSYYSLATFIRKLIEAYEAMLIKEGYYGYH